MKSEFTIGKALRPRGLAGELRFELYTSNSARFAKLKSAKLNGIAFDVSKITVEGEFAYIKFKGIESAEEAEKFRGALLTVLRDQLPQLPDGQNYIADLLGCDVFVDGDKLGELVDIQQYGSADVYIVHPVDNQGTVSFPALKELIKSTDVKEGKIVLDGYIFRRVAIVND